MHCTLKFHIQLNLNSFIEALGPSFPGSRPSKDKLSKEWGRHNSSWRQWDTGECRHSLARKKRKRTCIFREKSKQVQDSTIPFSMMLWFRAKLRSMNMVIFHIYLSSSNQCIWNIGPLSVIYFANIYVAITICNAFFKIYRETQTWYNNWPKKCTNNPLKNPK